jgi:hypothetical protein
MSSCICHAAFAIIAISAFNFKLKKNENIFSDELSRAEAKMLNVTLFPLEQSIRNTAD